MVDALENIVCSSLSQSAADVGAARGVRIGIKHYVRMSVAVLNAIGAGEALPLEAAVDD